MNTKKLFRRNALIASVMANILGFTEKAGVGTRKRAFRRARAFGACKNTPENHSNPGRVGHTPKPNTWFKSQRATRITRRKEIEHKTKL